MANPVAFGPDALNLAAQANKRAKKTRDSSPSSTTRVALQTLSQNKTPPSTPENSPVKADPRTPPRRFCTVVPPTPHKLRSTPPQAPSPLFTGELEGNSASLTNHFPELQRISIPYRDISSYQVGTLPTRIIFKQASSKDCGGAASLMALSDVAAQYEGMVTPNTSFSTWLARAYLYDGKRLVEGLSMAVDPKITPTLEKIPTEDPLSFIEEILQTSHLPVITAITHERVGGHWIVVDHISETDVFIRDPYSGKAYQIPKKEMESLYQDLPEEIVFFSIKETI